MLIAKYFNIKINTYLIFYFYDVKIVKKINIAKFFIKKRKPFSDFLYEPYDLCCINLIYHRTMGKICMIVYGFVTRSKDSIV